jgi:hypothetical protein
MTLNDLTLKSREHLSGVHEDYFEHMRFALGFGLKLLGAALAVIIHALIPALFETKGSATVFRLADELANRSHHHH